MSKTKSDYEFIGEALDALVVRCSTRLQPLLALKLRVVFGVRR
jgi:hypothetical protein